MLGIVGWGLLFGASAAWAEAPSGYFNNHSHYYPSPHVMQRSYAQPWHGAGPAGRLRQVPPGGMAMDIEGNVFQRTSARLGFVNGRPYYSTDSGVLTPDGFVSDYDPTPWYTDYANSVRWVNGPTVSEERSAALSEYWEQRRQQIRANQPSFLPPQYRRHPVYNR